MPPSPVTTRLRVVPPPVTEPPYDDEVTDPVPVVRGSLALAFPPSTAPAVPLRLVPPALPARPAAGDPPDPLPWTGRLAQAIVEVLAGVRGAAQLSPFATLEVLSHLERACGRFAGRPSSAPAPRPTIRSTRVSRPGPGVAEASVVIATGKRNRAMAIRLEARGGHWQCTALEIG